MNANTSIGKQKNKQKKCHKLNPHKSVCIYIQAYKLFVLVTKYCKKDSKYCTYEEIYLFI